MFDHLLTEQRLDTIFSNVIAESAFIWATLLVWSTALWLMRRQPIAIKVICPSIMAFATLCFCMGVPLGWWLRDGLGPGMVESHGQEAIAKFTKDFWELPKFCALLFAIALFPPIITDVVRQKRKSKQNKADSAAANR